MSAVCSYLVISSRLLSIHRRLGHSLLFFPGTAMSIICLDSWLLLLICPYQFNRFCLMHVDIWHTLSSSSIIWYLTWSFLFYHLFIVASSFLLHAICSRLSFKPPNTLLHISLLAWSPSYTPCLSAWWVPFCRIARPSAASISSKLVQPGCRCTIPIIHLNRRLIPNIWMLLLYTVYHPLVVFIHNFWNCCHIHCTACTLFLSGWLSVHVFQIGLAISPVLSLLL